MRLLIDLAAPGRFEELVDDLSSRAWMAFENRPGSPPPPQGLAAVRRAVKGWLAAFAADPAAEGHFRDLVFRGWEALERFEIECAGEIAAAVSAVLDGRPSLDLVARILPEALRPAWKVRLVQRNPGAPPRARGPHRGATAWRHRRGAKSIHGQEFRGWPRNASFL